MTGSCSFEANPEVLGLIIFEGLANLSFAELSIWLDPMSGLPTRFSIITYRLLGRDEFNLDSTGYF